VRKLLKFLRLDNWLQRQVELGRLERERASKNNFTSTLISNQNDKSEEEIISRYVNKKREKRRNVLLALISVLVVFYVIGSNSSSDNSVNSPYPVIEEDLTSWIPVGFESWSSDPNVAWRWLDNKEFKCEYDRSCVGIMVVAKNGCESNLYAEVSLLDSNKVQSGSTNDSVSSALSMEESRLVFNTYEEEADTVRVSKISCY
jgi:hypothetical protein